MMLDHPFILKLYAAMQDLKYIYFVLELLLGGELFTWLRKQGRFDEPGAKFYSAQVVLGFQHMHQKKVAYRDLKPENLVLDDKGYLKIVDLGLAKVVEGKTWTLCGTPDYLAPEIILNEGHDKAVDYWALGVLIYELVAGMPPFYADDPMEVYEKILSSNLTIPQHFTKNLTDVVRKLLKLCQSKRLGNGKGGCGAIIKHKWFSGFDWEGLKNYELPSPITIKLSSTEDKAAAFRQVAHGWSQRSNRVCRTACGVATSGGWLTVTVTATCATSCPSSCLTFSLARARPCEFHSRC